MFVQLSLPKADVPFAAQHARAASGRRNPDFCRLRGRASLTFAFYQLKIGLQIQKQQVAGRSAMTAWKLAYHANCWGPLGGDAVGVTSITRLAYRTFGDMERAARDIAAAGYQGIEFFDGNVVDGEGDGYADTRRVLDETGLVARRDLQRRQLHLRRHPRRGTGADRRRRPTPRRRSAPSIWSSAAARGATTERATATTMRSAAALDKVRRHRRGARPPRPLPSAPLDHRRKPR